MRQTSLMSLKQKQKQLAQRFNFSFRYIDDVLSLKNSRFGDFLNLIYPSQFEIKDTTDTDKSASCLDLHLEIDTRGRFYLKILNFMTNVMTLTFQSSTSIFERQYSRGTGVWSVYFTAYSLLQSLCHIYRLHR